MGRRSDHTRAELKTLLVKEGCRQMARAGFATFSARKVATAVGYSVGTISNVFGNVDGLVTAINTSTIEAWNGYIVRALANCVPGDDPIAVLVKAYFGFAASNTNLWMAIFDHRRGGQASLDEDALAARGKLVGLIDAEVCRFLNCEADSETYRLTRSLIAIVHGHCALALCGTFALLGEIDPVHQAAMRVHEVLDRHRVRPIAATHESGR